MKSPSLDLPSLLKEVESLNQQKLILQSTIQGSQKEWVAQKKKIAQQTKLAIDKSTKEIEDALFPLKSELESTNEAIKAQKLVLTDTKKEANETAESLTGEIDHLTTIKKTLISRIDVLTVEKETCDKALELSKDELDKLEAQKSTVTTNISVLNDEKVKLFDKIDELSKELQNKETQFEDAMSSYRDESQKLEDELKVLEQKKIKMVSDMEENARTDEQSRNALALRQRLLDDREENLRIRETKVSQQEESISRNNTLLNLQHGIIPATGQPDLRAIFII